MDYEPLDLSSLCNATDNVYDPSRYNNGGTYLQPRPSELPIGDQIFRGLPFRIGNPDNPKAPCLIALNGSDPDNASPVIIAVSRKAKYIIFAHAVLETQLWHGGSVGAEIAKYTFELDNNTITVPIRERFEIGNIPIPWGQFPFLSVPDQEHYLEDRHEGRWDHFGFRQTEVTMGVPRAYFIWAWTNPYPDDLIKSIIVTPIQNTFVIAGITTSYLDEYPLVRATRSPVKITLLNDESASQPFNLSVSVDRGWASYAYPLPAIPLDEDDPTMRGFGAPRNQTSNPAYVQIAANPSATVQLKQGDDVLMNAKWEDLREHGSAQNANARLEVIDSGKNWVQTTVIDEDTRQPVPCRIAFHSPDGVPFAPHGHHAPVFGYESTWNIDVGGDVTLGQVAYAYTSGACQGWLPRGRVLVDIARGYEYEPIRTWINIEEGQQTLELTLKRWVDMNEQRYFSGDTHVHFLSAQGSMTEARAEDLNVVNLLQSQWGNLFTNTEEFTGQPHIAADGDTIVYVSQENRQHILGHLSLLGLKTPVMPWCSGGPGEAEIGGGLDITMSRWADMARAQGGTVILPHIPTPNGEPAAMIATERADAVEMLDFLEFEHLEYYRYLNGGYRLPLVGGTDKMSNETPVGLYRTYVHIPENVGFNYTNWCKALRGGRTFVSGGAMLWFEIDGQPIGSTLKVGKGGMVEIHTTARSIFPIHTLQIVSKGKVVAETTESNGSRHLELRTQLKIEEDSWLVARCAGPQYTAKPHYDARGRGIMAHTSPIYVTTGNEYTLLEPATAQYMLTLISGGLDYIRHLSPQHTQYEVTHHHGFADHIGYLEEPFHEAVQALHARMHRLGIPH